jgi:hypothetical protein
VFWAQSSLTDIDLLHGLDTTSIAAGKRGFVIDAAHASIWSGIVESIEITVVLKGGISFQCDVFAAEPGTYTLRDSTIA